MNEEIFSSCQSYDFYMDQFSRLPMQILNWKSINHKQEQF